MKSYRRLRRSNPRVLACLFTLVGIALFSVATVQASPQYDLDCASCHGMPPLDSESGDRAPATGAFKGSHQGHANSNISSCATCHGDQVTAYSTAHRSKTIEFTDALGYSRKTSGVFFNQTSVPPVVLGTCSTAACHSDGKGNLNPTPAWGSAPFAAPGSCSQCHDVAPATGNHPVADSKHAAYFGTGTDSCATCHSNHAAEAKPFAHATSAGRAIEVKFSGGGTFAANQCSNLYCHSNGQTESTRVYVPPTWGGTLTCAGCHGDTTGAASLSGSHAKHLAKNGISCEDCHFATANGSAAIKNTGYTTHANGSVDVGGGSVTSYQAAPGVKNCATVCHNGTSPIWGNPGNGTVCGTCHSVGTPFSNTFSQYYTDDPALHNAHFGGNNVAYGPNISIGTNGSGCAACHAFTDVNGATHDNRVINLDTTKVAIITGSSTLDLSNSGITAKCATCHTQATVWKSSASNGGNRLACESCHSTAGGALSVIGGTTAPDKTSAATTGHGKTGIAQGCTACHDNSSSHIGVSGGTKRLLGNYSSSTAGAGCNNCHDSSVVSNADKKNMKVHRSSGLGSSCSDCHNVHGTANSNMVNTTINGTAISFNGTSSFANGGQTGVCQTCHTATQYFTKTGTPAPKTHVDSTTNCLECHKHNPGTGLSFAANGACNACHGYPPTPINPAVAFGIQGNWSSARTQDYTDGGGAHLVAAHVAKSAKPSEQWANCTTCHSGGAATHTRAMPMLQHIENVKVSVDSQYRFDNSFIVYTGARQVSAPDTNNTGSCFNVSCHMGQSPLWTAQNTMTCSSCHQMPPLDSATTKKNPATSAVPGSHQGHANTNVTSCVKCHGDQVTAYSTAHRNKTIEFTDALGYSRKTSGVFFNQTSVPPAVLGTCSTAACHSDGKGKQSITPAWGSAQFTAPGSCSQCHDVAPATGNHPVLGSKHAAYFGTGTDSCSTCHSNHAAEAKPFAHATSAGRAIEVKFAGGGTFAANQCSNLYCHSNGQTGAARVYVPPTWGSSLTCAGCHGDTTGAASLSGSHAKHLAKNGITCEDCHYATANGSAAIKDTGYTTHANGSVDVGGGIVTSYQATSGVKNCATVCHNGTSPIWGNPGNTSVCGTCHSVGTPFNNTFNQYYADDPAIHNVHFGGNNVAYGPNISIGTNGSGCATCHAFTDVNGVNHDNQVINLDSSKVTITVGSTTLAKSNSGITAKCSTCHTQSTVWKSSASAGGSRLACESCHSTVGGALSVIGGTTAPDKTSAATTGHGKTGIAQGCTACHDNSSSHIGVSGGTKRLLGNYSSSTAGAGCNNCHDSAVVTNVDKKNMKVHRSSGLGSSCSDCHNVHGTANSNMVNTTINGTAISFSGTSSFANVGQTGVCQTCHTATQYYTKAGITPKSHVTSSTNCVGCHKHNPDTGFAFTANGACDACHGYPPMPADKLSARAIGEFVNAKFEDYTGGGGYHSSHLLATVTASEGFTPCLPCHPSTSHLQGVSVVKSNVNVFDSGDTSFRLNAGLPKVYDNTSNTCSNVSCHFKASPAWY